MPKTSSKRPSAPKATAAAPRSLSANASKPTQSSILKTAFAPAELDLPLFASTIRSLGSEILRIHDTLTGQLKSVHTISGTAINCIRWGVHDQGHLNEHSSKKKKRKLDDGQVLQLNGVSPVIAIGSGQPEIQLFSPLEGKVSKILRNGHDRGTRDFVFEKNQRAWSLGAAGSLIQWDLETLSRIRNIEAPASSLTRLDLFSSYLLLASQSAYIYDPASLDLKTIPCFTTPIHSLVSEPAIKSRTPAHFCASAESTSTIGVYSSDTLSITGNLNARNPARDISLYSLGGTSLLYATSEAGDVEIFESPFQNWSTSGDDLKAKRKKTTRRSNATVQTLRHKDSADILPAIDAIIDTQGILVLAIVEDSVNLGFERIQILNDQGALIIRDTQTLIRPKSRSLVNQSANGAKDDRRAHIDESRATVGHSAPERDDVLDEGESEALEESSEDDQEEDDKNISTHPQALQTNGTLHSDTEMMDVQKIELEEEEAREDVDPETDEKEEPTFGELIKARGAGTIEVSDSRALQTTTGLGLPLSSNLTLATLLTQALNTNDSASLDTCLAQQDIQVIRATIERLDANLALTLLHRLAERLHKRPGRAGSLLVWVQWTIVAHGGYLASREDTVQQLRSLHKVVQERAKSLQPLLALKGKLDMLDAQIAFRKKLYQNHMASAGALSRPEDMIYIEGQSESDTDAEMQSRNAQAGEEVDGDVENETEDDDDDDDDEEEAQSVGQVEEDDLDGDSQDAASESASDLSEEEDEGEVDHDDIDPEDSDTSASGLASIPGPRVNGTKT